MDAINQSKPDVPACLERFLIAYIKDSDKPYWIHWDSFWELVDEIKTVIKPNIRLDNLTKLVFRWKYESGVLQLSDPIEFDLY